MNFNNLEKSIKETPKHLNNEHLKDEFSPLIGCIYDRTEMSTKDKVFFENFKLDAVFVDYSINPIIARGEGFKNNGKETYTISQIDNENKYSKEYYDCTAVCATGVDKITGENISFLSHQDPKRFLKDSLNNFKNDLNERLDEMAERCLPESIDVVILGGNKNIKDISDLMDFDRMNQKQIGDFFDQNQEGPFDVYRKSIYFISKIVFEKLKFYPVVMAGPNSNVKINDYTHSNALDLYFDTKNRRIYQVRPENESINNDSFKGNEINDKIGNF